MVSDTRLRLKKKSYKPEGILMSPRRGSASGPEEWINSTIVNQTGSTSILTKDSLRLLNLNSSIRRMLGGKRVNSTNPSSNAYSGIFGSMQLSKLLSGTIRTLHFPKTSSSPEIYRLGILSLGSSTSISGMVGVS